jgi:nuclear RNA export factor
MLDNVYLDPAIRQKINSEIATPPIVGTDANGRPILPLKVKGKFIHDDQGIAMQFLSTFFGTYQQNRSGILQQFYDADSMFSISVNTSAPRSGEQQNVRQYWDGYIPKSRNLKRVAHLKGRIERLAAGTNEIGKLWNELPTIRYNLANDKLWSFDVWPIEITTGVMGIICVVHAEFEELNMVDNEEKVVKRSFDRTFTLHPDARGEVKVGNDALVVRAYGGCNSWKEEEMAEVMEENKQKMCAEIMKQTGLRLDWAKLCLEETGWDMDKAWQAFLEAKVCFLLFSCIR